MGTRYRIRMPLWIRSTSVGMLVVFVYVNVLYGAIKPANNFWEQRKV